MKRFCSIFFLLVVWTLLLAATATQFPTSYESSMIGWTNPQNAELDDGIYAIASPAKNEVIDTQWKNFKFNTVIPVDVQIQSVKIMAEYRVSTTSSNAHLHAQATVSGINCPVKTLENTLEPLTDTVVTFDITSCRNWTREDLKNANFYVHIGAHRGNSAAPVTFFLDYVKVEVQYGALTVDIVNGSGKMVVSPVVAFPSLNFSFDAVVSEAVFGTASQKIRIFNSTKNPFWTLAIAATDGPAALMNSGSGSHFYDYNDDFGAADGSDADSYGGQLTINPSVGTVIPVWPCSSIAGIAKGSVASFREIAPAVSSITLLATAPLSGAATDCSWDFTGVSLSHIIPASQVSGSYTISFTLTVT